MNQIRVYAARIKRKSLFNGYKLLDAILDSDKSIRYWYYQNGYHNNDYKFNDQQISFVHIPKTAGTSFSLLLKQDPEAKFINLDIHRPVSKWCDPEAYKYVTILRNPIDQVWSLYQMNLRSPEGHPYRKFAVRGLKTFLEKNWSARNMACRYISGVVEPEPSRQTLDRALRNLEYFHAVLSFEDFNEEASRFLQRAQIAHSIIPHERNKAYPKPSTDDLDLIKQHNELDILLFDTWKKSRQVQD